MDGHDGAIVGSSREDEEVILARNDLRLTKGVGTWAPTIVAVLAIIAIALLASNGMR